MYAPTPGPRPTTQAPAVPTTGRARFLAALACGLIVLIAVSAAALVNNLHQRAIAAKSRELTNLAMVLAEEVERTFEAVEGAQQDIADRIKERGGHTHDPFVQLAGSSEIVELLETKASSLSYVDALSVVSRDGVLLNSSRPQSSPYVDLSGSEFFRSLHRNGQAETFLSLPYLSPASGRWTIYFARKVRDAEGALLGMAVGSMPTAYFEEFYEQIKAGEQTEIAMYRSDGHLLAGHPLPRQVIGKRLMALHEGDHGLPVMREGKAVEMTSTVDGVRRLAAVAVPSAYPVVLQVSVPVSTVVASWREDAWVIVGGATLLCIIIGVCFMLSSRQLRNQYEIARAAYDMARCDTLTGLPNRLSFIETLSRRPEPPDGAQTALLLIDLDVFKDVNEELGQDVGDLALKKVAQRIQAATRPEDFVARVAGDEFAVVRHASDPESIGVLAASLIAAIAEPWYVRNYRIVLSASVGVALSRPGDDADALLNHAETALLCARGEGRRRWRMFEKSMDAAQATRRVAETALREALERHGFELYYQPLVNTQTARLEGFEALLRWREPRLAELGAPQVIAVAEETGLIVPLGKWVLDMACAEAAKWPGNVRVAVNVSAWQFRSGKLLDHVRGALKAANLPAERLELEITETVLLQNTAYVHSTLDELRSMGVRISLDDFGTGYSSLLYLRRFPADRIKIDMAFVAGICTNPESARIVQAIVNLGHSLGMQTTGEGVESQAQWDQLRRAGCTEIQGYFVGRPCPAEEVRVFFEKYGVEEKLA